jgi:DNA-binding CsgD family transcriptional regulator
VLENHELKMDDGVWRWSGELHPTTRLNAILEDRLRRVDASGRTILDVLALGEPLSLDALSALCGDSFERFGDLEGAGLVVVDNAHEVRLSHPLYAELLSSAMTTTDRRILTTKLADAFEPDADVSRLTVLRVATWRLESGRVPQPSLLVDAAEVAIAAFDYALAERLARRALDENAGLRAALALAEALSRLSRGAEAAAVLEPLAGQAGSDAERLQVVIARSLALTSAYGYRAEFARFVHEAEASVRDPHAVEALRVERAHFLVYGGHLEEGLALAAPALDAGADPLTRIRAFNALGAGWLCAGKVDSLCSLAMELLGPALAHQDEMPLGPMSIMAASLPALIVSGRIDEADATIGAIEAATPASDRSHDFSTYLTLTRGIVALFRGQVATAQRSLRESVPGMRAAALWRLSFPLALLAEAAALNGDAETAVAASEEADALVERARSLEGMVRRARAWAAFARGQRSLAAQLASDAAEWSGAHAQHTAEVLAWHDALRLAGDRAAATRLTSVGSTLEGEFGRVMTAHASAFLDNDGHALEAVSRQFEAIGSLLRAAEAAGHASVAFHRTGLAGRAERASARARTLRAACEGAHSPSLADLDEPVQLTRREREVVALAAEGLPSHVIAERLFVSTRTVEGHLHRSYAKLGVSDRRDLARLRGLGSSV